uniref:Uncharacterized protein n=1 Tax=Oryza rufipogon TaxID=4529 RepID=A0A0E0PX44_ORYRU
MAKPTAEGAQQPCESWASTGGALLAGVLNSGWNDERANSSKKSMADTTSCLASPTRHVAAERAIPASMWPTEVERVLKQHRQPQSQETSTTTVLRWHHGRRQLKLQVDDQVNIFTRESGQLKQPSTICHSLSSYLDG